VDDDPTTRKLVQAVLSKHGYQVLLAPTGQDGVDSFIANRPDLVLMDVQMPGMNGFEACALIRQLDGHATPIIMLTGSEDLESIESAFTAGATDFITKPINFPLLAQRVRYALAKQRAQPRAARCAPAPGGCSAHCRLGVLGLDGRNPTCWNGPMTLTPCSAARQTCPRRWLTCCCMVHPGDRNRVGQAFFAVRESGGKLDVEFRLHDDAPTGERIITMTGERAEDDDPLQPVRVFGAFQNVTDSRRTQAMVDYLAFHDELTGLANRSLFVRQIRDFFAMPEATQQALMVSWIDLARFARVNEALGESSGDALLAQVAQRLKSASAGYVGLARVGGDEFGLALRCRNESEAEDKLQRVLQALDQPFTVNDQEVFVSVCAGWSLSVEHGQEAEALLNQAMDAQQQARLQGYKSLKASKSASTNRSFGSLDVELDLRKALQNNQFVLHYQPQMALRGNRIVGVESLLRWQHPVRGLVPPVQFIPVLEDMGLIQEVGAWALREACRQATAWANAGIPLRVAINLSPRQFMGTELFGLIQSAVDAHQTPPHLVELEITESLAMQDPDRAIELLTQLRAEGYKVAIDDFGIGHSSLEYLLRFPIDTIKIDRAFVMRVTETETDRAVIRAITAIAQSLQLTTIAEGVETQRQCDFMEALGASEIQGYFISRPMPEAALTSFVQGFKYTPT
jgi:diguanylate cyclase (GGDEF)-like protein